MSPTRGRGRRIGYYNGTRHPSDFAYMASCSVLHCWLLQCSPVALRPRLGGSLQACMSASPPSAAGMLVALTLAPVGVVPVNEEARREEEDPVNQTVVSTAHFLLRYSLS